MTTQPGVCQKTGDLVGELYVGGGRKTLTFWIWTAIKIT